jgi:large subunit ribosomal protein L30
MSTTLPPIRKLVITLRRGLAGVREDHAAVVSALGLRRRGSAVRLPNNASVRGAVAKVGHLLTVQTDEQAAAAAAAAAAKAAPREPLAFEH